MNVTEFTALLKAGEFKKLYLKNNEPDVLGFVNLGLLDLYTKFPLWRENVDITYVVGIKDYRFDGDDVNVAFYPDESQLLLIEEVTTVSTEGDEKKYIPSNSTRPEDFSTPISGTLRINEKFATFGIFTEIRLAPKTMKKCSEEILLPPQFLELLILYCAYKAHSTVSAAMDGENNTYFIRYDRAVKEFILRGQHPIDSLESSKLYQRGFL